MIIHIFLGGDKRLNMHSRDPKQEAKGCVIWMHGLGADAADMMGVADELKQLPPVRHVFLEAPVRPVTINNNMSMRAWYDIPELRLNGKEDRVGIIESENTILKVLNTQIEDGFSPDTIFLAGFSQGGAMAMFTGLRTPYLLGGIIMLSGPLLLASETPSFVNIETPMYIASGAFDPLILPAWSKMSVEHLRSHGCRNIAYHSYPMAHSICPEEIRDLEQWISKILADKESK